MVTLHAAPTAALDAPQLRAFRTLLDAAFDGDFTDTDWASTIGGLHVWVSNADALIAHAALVDRVLVCSGHTLRVGYVEAVATAAAYRRRGHGTSIMKRVAGLIRERYALGALSTGAHAFYEVLGWERWRGPTFVDARTGRERTPGEDGGVMILRTPRSPSLDLDGDIVCDWREGDVW